MRIRRKVRIVDVFIKDFIFDNLISDNFTIGKVINCRGFTLIGNKGFKQILNPKPINERTFKTDNDFFTITVEFLENENGLPKKLS